MSRWLALASGVAAFCALSGHPWGDWYRERPGIWRRDCPVCDAKQRTR